MGVLTCSTAPVVTPVATVTWQYVRAGKIAFPDVSVNVVVCVPELLAEAAKVVVPQPNGTGVEGVAMDAVGSITEKASPTDRYVFNSKVKDTDVVQVVPDDVNGLAMSRALYVIVGLYRMAVDA
jgi:hypothetical protein